MEEERTLRTPVAPFTAVSIGNETSCSTSSGASPGASVIIVTVGALRSGKTSTSIFFAVYIPHIRSNAAAIITTNLLSKENFIILLSIVKTFLSN